MSPRQALAALIHRTPATEPEPDDIEQWIAGLADTTAPADRGKPLDDTAVIPAVDATRDGDR